MLFLTMVAILELLSPVSSNLLTKSISYFICRMFLLSNVYRKIKW